ncbi:hypothetical protein BH10PAT1_BH10PAT1_5910 [soil metagenome]
MIFLIILVFEILFLYFLSRKVTSKIFYLVRNKYLFAVLFLPGTFIHEISHFLFALFLLVPVGTPEFLPVQIEGGIKMGSVPIGKTDPIRRTLIGIAPIIFGLIILFLSIYYVHNVFLLGFIVFEVGNTMFSSKKDLEGVIPVIVTLIIFIIVFYFLGLRINLIVNEELFKKADLFLLVPIGIDLVFTIF